LASQCSRYLSKWQAMQRRRVCWIHGWMAGWLGRGMAGEGSAGAAWDENRT
jgi:hypothetical protein